MVQTSTSDGLTRAATSIVPEEVEQFRSLVEAMREAGEAAFRRGTAEARKVCERRRRHRCHHAADVRDDHLRAAIRERGGQQPGDLLVERIGVTQRDLQRIRGDR